MRPCPQPDPPEAGSAPELRGRAWLNVSQEAPPPTLRGLRGRFVLLDFWTFCCLNCLHVIDELRSAGGDVRRGAGRRRRALAEVRARGGSRRPGRGRGPLRRAPPRPRRPRADHLVGLRRPGLADAGADRPGGLRRRGVRRGGARARARGPALPAGRRAPAPGHPARRRTRRTSRGEPGPASSASRPPRSPCPGGRVLVADAGHDEVVLLAGPRGVSSARYRGFREPNGLCLLPPTVAARSATTSWSPTPSASPAAGLSLATGSGVGRGRGRQASGGPATGPTGCPRRGTSPGGRPTAGCGSPWPGSTSCGPSTR